MTVSNCDVMEQAPVRTDAQRFEALQRANRIRSHRAELKRDLKRGRRAAVDVLEDPEDDVLTMKVIDLLLAMPKVGRTKANKWLSQARVSPSKTLGGMTGRQRSELLALMPGGRLPAARVAQRLREARSAA